MTKKICILTPLMALMFWAVAPQAHAALQLKLTDNLGNTVLVTDNGAGDSNPNVGAIGYSGAVGDNWYFNMSGGVSKPSLGSAAAPQLDINTKDFSSGPGTLTIQLSDTDFTAPAPVSFIASIGGTTVGSVSYNTYVDPGNANFAKTTVVTSQGVFSTSPFSDNQSVSGNPGGPSYSLTLETVISHATAGSSGFDANLSGASSSQPGLQLLKTASATNALPGQPVTYSYAVTNTGNINLTNLNIVDDNGTPADPNDDYFVNAAPFTLAAGQGTQFAIPHITVPLCTIVGGTNTPAGTLSINVLTNGNIEVIYLQSRSLVDNTYGTGAVGWTGGHKFTDLTGSDKAEFSFRDTKGTVVLDFNCDYISAATSAKFGNGLTVNYPSSYGTLGPNGGDGKMLVGNSNSVLSVQTTFSDTLNLPAYQSGFTVNSPLPEGSNPNWNYVDGYRVVISKSAFGTNGFGSVTIPLVHNSPPKIGSNAVYPTNVCDCVINTAFAFALQGSTLIASATNSARVCFGPPRPCTELGSCTPPYPFASTNLLTSIDFNEPECLVASVIKTVSNCVPTQVQVFYNDEHAMTLGIRQLITKTKSGTVVTLTTNNYAMKTLSSNPGGATNPAVGATMAQGGVDVSGRPMFPAMFVTDITSPGNPLAGDWQYGGTPQPPSAVFGTWKGAVAKLDKTVTPNVFTVTPDINPAKNNLNLGSGSDPFLLPAPLKDQGYSSEVRWNVSDLKDNLGLALKSGHTYRLYFMVHDGDQNKSGGDVGQACGTITLP